MKPSRLIACVVAAVAFICAAQAQLGEPGKTQVAAADPMHGKQPGDARDDNGLKMKFVWCPPGIFAMENIDGIEEPAAEGNISVSSDDEFDATVDPATTHDEADDAADKVDVEAKPVSQVSPAKVFLKRGYWLGKCEVTQSEWKQVMATEPWKGKNFLKEGDDFPVTSVSWDDAMNFCRKLTAQERMQLRLPVGWEYTLPTEAQWERACRARTQTKFSFGDDEVKLGDFAWFNVNSRNARQPGARAVGQKKPNPWGLYDMHGNVWEWCRDVYDGRLRGGINPEATQGACARVFRGGSWYV